GFAPLVRCARAVIAGSPRRHLRARSLGGASPWILLLLCTILRARPSPSGLLAQGTGRQYVSPVDGELALRPHPFGEDHEVRSAGAACGRDEQTLGTRLPCQPTDGLRQSLLFVVLHGPPRLLRDPPQR